MIRWFCNWMLGRRPWKRHIPAPPVRASIDWDVNGRPLADYLPPKLRPEAPAEPTEPPPDPIDGIEGMKCILRRLPYGEFMRAAKGLGFDPATAWKWANDLPADVVQLRMAA